MINISAPFQNSYIYTVCEGDTIHSLARRFGSSAEAMVQVNHLYDPVTDLGIIFPGDVLVIPGFQKAGKVSYIVRSGETIHTITSKLSTFSDLLFCMNRLEKPHILYPDQPLIVPVSFYRIRSGDTLPAVAQKLGISLSKIIKANQGRPGFQAGVIWPGLDLIIPLSNTKNRRICIPGSGKKIGNEQQIGGTSRTFERK